MTGIQEKESHFRHVPVLFEEVLQYAPEGCRAVLDCTLGGAGHSIGLLERLEGFLGITSLMKMQFLD